VAQYNWGSDERYAPGQVAGVSARETAVQAMRARRMAALQRQQKARQAAMWESLLQAGLYSPVLGRPDPSSTITPTELGDLAAQFPQKPGQIFYGVDANKVPLSTLYELRRGR
jgi:hypothetical protein